MKRMLISGIIGAFLISLVFVPKLYADGPQEHSGFYLRMQAGLASTQSKGTDIGGTMETEVSDIAGVFRIDVGGAIRENLILFGTVGAHTIIDPDVEIDGRTYSSADEDTTYSIADYGFGITYYFMPTNIYIGGSVNIAEVELESGNVTGTSDTGYGIYLNAGKEWWVSDNWGLGAAVFGYFGNVPDKGEGEFQNSSFGVLFSATFN